MIYVHFDLDALPQDKLDAIRELATALDQIAGVGDRKKFIADNRAQWAELREDFLAISKNKCWYSEAREAVSRFQIDHFRPHGRAKQALKDFAEGYSWLAFDPLNYRLAGVLCNTQNQEHSEETVGKGDWFPIRNPAVRASMANRDCTLESPILLDPIDPEDPPKLIFNEDGSAAPAPHLGDDEQGYVADSIRYLGLNQDILNRKRSDVWKDCWRKIRKFNRIACKPKGDRTAGEIETMRELASEMISMTVSEAEFSAVSRSCLLANRLEYFIERDELKPLEAAD